MPISFPAVNSNWSLFLDRDGVINVDTPGDYVRNWNQFQFFETSLLALKFFAGCFSTIVIVTNQRGVGLGLMSIENLEEIHQNMLKEVQQAGGRIDRIYFSTDTDKQNSKTRKPATGMALQAKLDFPKIDFSKSIMVGNNISDMLFGRAMGMTTVFIDDRQEYHGNITSEMDFIFNNLGELALAISDVK